MTTAFLSALDPTLLEGVRGQLADGFAGRVFDAIPEISDFIEFQADARAYPVEQGHFERAAQMLTENRLDLRNQVAVLVRRNLDAKMLPFLGSAGRKTHLSLDALTLMADERLDEEIAVNQCTRRLKEQCEYELWGLTQRVCILIGRDSFTDSDNPVFPQLFAKSLMDALTALDMLPAARLAVFKAFGPALLDIVAAVYHAANGYLTARGIDVNTGNYYGLPVTRPDRAFAAQPTPQEIALGVASSNHALVATLRNLIDLSSSHHRVYVDESGGPAPTAVPLLASTLKLPVMRLAVPAVENALPAEPLWRGGLKQMEDKPAGQAAPGSRARALHQARQSLHDQFNIDEQVITDVVTAMFDRLFVEPRIALQLQPVIRRLQLPVLELALKDRSLLTQVQHPVRKLIDLMAEFGLTLELNAGDETTVLSVANIVDGLLHIRDVEPRAFTLAFERLDDLFYHHEEAALQRNESVRALERSEAGEIAGHFADREIAMRLQSRLLPPAVTQFIVTVWRDVLVNGYVKNGPRGEAWKLELATLDDLLKSLSPATLRTERERLATQLPPRIALLQAAPDNARQDPSVMEGFFAELKRLHERALAGDWAAVDGQTFVPSPDALSATYLTDSPSAQLAAMGMACGDWIETRDARGRRRWRLNWITSIRGTCVFKHYESNTTRNMSIDELRASLAAGDTLRVRGLGLADEIINDAFEVVLRKVRRSEPSRAPATPHGLRAN